MMKDEFYTSCLTQERRSKTMKDEFYTSYLKKKNSTPTEKVELIDYHQDEERNDNVDDYPSVHTTLQQSSGD